ncbi:MAG: beta-propeller domain-containing protein, partial [Myxococcales bacterium]|nr:beta-propeller domain-containing protein [Myxococcales bacterium]
MSSGRGRSGARLPRAQGSITNNQVAGVDEGDIVKAVGDHLVVLRRGRLFSIRVGDDSLRPVGRIDLAPPGHRGGTWYDELLVQGRTLVVIGYSYRYRATEIELLELGASGEITRTGTYFLRSGDYYSSRNYTGRIVDGRLVFYVPARLETRPLVGGRIAGPSLLRFDGGRIRGRRRLLRAQDVAMTTGLGLYPVLHTIVSCELSGPELGCGARAVLGPAGRTVHVGRDAVYLWVTSRARGGSGLLARPATLFRIPLGPGEPGALRVRGSPIDQLSFLEDDDGFLNVLLRAAGRGEGMWDAEHGAGGVALLRVPVALISSAAPRARAAAYRPLPDPGSTWGVHNRYVGDHLLYGAGRGWRRSADGGAGLQVHSLRDGVTHRVELGHGVDRIEALEQDALIVGHDGSGLVFSTLRLQPDAGPPQGPSACDHPAREAREDAGQPPAPCLTPAARRRAASAPPSGGEPDVSGQAPPRLEARHVEPGLAQGEVRTHGFFYAPRATSGAAAAGPGAAGGLLGLPVRARGEPGFAHLVRGSLGVLYLRVERAAGLELSRSGVVWAGRRAGGDGCTSSCVDWYGNARPIFHRGRIFALMGYELVEARVGSAGLGERRRVDFLQAPAPPPPPAVGVKVVAARNDHAAARSEVW